jgi:hypothetical protein
VPNFLSPLFIILVLSDWLFTGKMLLSNTSIFGFIPNLHKKSWTASKVPATCSTVVVLFLSQLFLVFLNGHRTISSGKILWSWNREKNRYTIISRNILMIFDLTNFLTNFFTHFWRNFDAFLTHFLTLFMTNYLTHFLTNHFTNFWRIFWPLRALGLEYLRSCFFTCFHKRKYFLSANLEN